MVRVADKGDLYVHQGERAYMKWDHSPSRDCQGAVPPWAQAACSRARLGKSPHARTGPKEVSTMRTPGGANWKILGLILDTPRWGGSEGAAHMSQRDRRASPAAACQGRASLGGSVVERYVYTPYGQVTVHAETGYGGERSERERAATGKASMDASVRPATCPEEVSTRRTTGGYDEDNEVMGEPPSTSDADYTAFTGACAGSGPTGACRKLDLDFDGDVDTTDRDDYFMSLPHGLARHPGRTATAVDQPFGHQGLLFEPEIGSYSSRNEERTREYSPSTRRPMQPYSVSPRYIYSMTKRYRRGMNLYAHAGANPVNVGTSGAEGGKEPCNCNYIDPNTSERYFAYYPDGPSWCKNNGSHGDTHRCYQPANATGPTPPVTPICPPAQHLCFPRNGNALGAGEDANLIDMKESHVDCFGYLYNAWGGGCAVNNHCVCLHLAIDYLGDEGPGNWICSGCPQPV